jgi:hypothetical protein
MMKFIPYEKLSKKMKKEHDAKKRRSWGGINPVTRKPKNPKAYDRRKARRIIDEISGRYFLPARLLAPSIIIRRSLLYEYVLRGLLSAS